MNKRILFPAAVMGCSFLGACSTPFGDKLVNIDWSSTQLPGTISVSDPRMYRREALINERNALVNWHNELLEKVTISDFKPEIVREIETVRQLSLALGYNFDSSAGRTSRRASELADIQQEIDVVKLRTQLNQLKRDVELVESKFGGQTEPVNSGVEKLGSGASASPTATITSTEQLKTANEQLKAEIDRLKAILTRFDGDSKPAAIANSSVNPIDAFRDISAYKESVISARNASSLDELHDFRGTALIRLNFEAIVVPEISRLKAAGVVQMKIVRPTFSAAENERLYRGWLNYINSRINVWTGSGWKPDNELLRSAVADNFDIAEYRYSPSKDGGRLQCPGFLLVSGVPDNKECTSLVFAVPKFKGTSVQEGAYSSLAKYLGYFDLKRSEKDDREIFQKAQELVPSQAKKLLVDCGIPGAKPMPENTGRDDARKLYDALDLARLRVAGGEALATVERVAQNLIEEKGFALPSNDHLSLIGVRMARAQMLISSFENVAYADCSDAKKDNFRNQRPSLQVPTSFSQILDSGENRVSIYQVGPREQVQQVSTVARTANSLALAASLTAAAPGSGQAVSAAGSYSRQAIGRAATFERVPSLVGYSVFDKKTFGWVIGPKATIDPKGQIELEQSLRTYDLSVDLSVPSWWPSFGIETVTAWAPEVRAIAEGKITLGSGTVPKNIPLSQNDADYAALTSRVALGGIEERRKVSLKERRLSGQLVSACQGSTLFIRGENIWRATVAVINGQRLGPDALSVAPDMSGILLTVPPLTEELGDLKKPTVSLRILTPYGEVITEVDYVPKPTAGCKPPDKKANTDGPQVTTVEPIQFVAPALITFQVWGVKLDQITRITLNGQVGTHKVRKDAKFMEVSFSREQTAGLPVSRTNSLSFFKDDEKLDAKLIEITANTGGKP